MWQVHPSSSHFWGVLDTENYLYSPLSMEKQWNERKYILNKQTNRPMLKRCCASFILGEQTSNDSLVPLPSRRYNVRTESYRPRKNKLIFTCGSLQVVVYLKMGFSEWNSLKA